MIDSKIRQQRIQTLFEDYSIISATIQSKGRMGFITHAWGDSDEGPEEREIIVILYDAHVLLPKAGGFIANTFTGVRRGIAMLSQDGKNSILGLFAQGNDKGNICLLYTSPSPRD